MLDTLMALLPILAAAAAASSAAPAAAAPARAAPPAGPDPDIRDAVLRAEEAALGRDHPEARKMAGKIEGLMRSLMAAPGPGVLTDPSERLEECLGRALGPEDLDTLSALNRLGFAMSKGGRHAEARAALDAAAGGRRKLLGPLAAPTLDSELGLSRALGMLGDFGAARDILDRLLPEIVLIYGPADYLSVLAGFGLAMVLARSGEQDAAKAAFSRVSESFNGVAESLGYGNPQSRSAFRRHLRRHVSGQDRGGREDAKDRQSPPKTGPMRLGHTAMLLSATAAKCALDPDPEAARRLLEGSGLEDVI
ncbi:MAG: tetratricopeptide repeat protein [Deltaproteobacteria bacterium]|nr:tetratricopeptide repeat protein [Deltaproteobacteria bacterium]